MYDYRYSEMVDVVHFLYKTIYFKIPFQEMFPSL